MVELRYGPVWTQVRADPLLVSSIKEFLSFEEEGSLLTDNHILTGLLTYVTDWLVKNDIPFEVKGAPPERIGNPYDFNVPEDYLEGVTLRGYQQELVRKCLWFKRGVVEAPTASGKTESTAAIAKWLLENKGLGTLVLVPGVTSMYQTVDRFRKRGIEDTGAMGDGVKDQKSCMVAVINSLYRAVKKRDKAAVYPLIKNLGCVVFMEAHHAPSYMWTTVGQALDTEYKLGLSGTPFMNGPEPQTKSDFTLIGITGPQIFRLPPSVLMNKGYLTVPRVHIFKVGGKKLKGNDWHMLKSKGITESATRNFAITDIVSELASKRRIMLLVSEVRHGTALIKEITKRTKEKAIMFSGNSTLREFAGGEVVSEEKVPADDLIRRLNHLPNYILVGSPALDEDFDLPSVDVLVVASFGKSFRRILQRAGRILRVHQLPDGSRGEAHIIDFLDNCSPILRRHSMIRFSAYEDAYGGADGFEFENHDSARSVIDALKSASEQVA